MFKTIKNKKIFLRVKFDIFSCSFTPITLAKAITSTLTTASTRIPDPHFSSFGPSRDYGMDLCLEVYP